MSMSKEKYFKHKKFNTKAAATKYSNKLKKKGFSGTISKVIQKGKRAYYKVYKY